MNPEVYVQSCQSTRICSVHRIFQTNYKLFVCAKEKQEIFHLVDP